jgi:hypothetical protein
MDEVDWTDMPGYEDEDDAAHEVVKRYARLSPFELRALRDQLRTLAKAAEDEWAAVQCRRLARHCSQVLSWHPYAAGWNWSKIVDNATLRGHAKCVRGALRNYPDETNGAPIFRVASAYYGYSRERHEEAEERQIEDEIERESFPRVLEEEHKGEPWIETFSDGYESDAPRQRVEDQYRDAGWTAKGGRDELEKLTEAILRATPTGAEREAGRGPPFSVFIDG